MDNANLNVVDTNQGVPDPKFQTDHGHAAKYDLGSPAEDVYNILAGINRQMVIDQSRRMAELTIPSVYPPLNYRVGEDLPGTNQSAGARAVNNLASKIMFMAFPPGQPMMRLTPVVQKLQKEIDQNPDLYASIELALSQVEKAHRKKAAIVGLATVWVGYIKLLLISGNALWKHITLECPTYHPLDEWVTSRDMGGHPLVTIHQENVRCSTLPLDIQKIIYEEDPELLKLEDWSRETTIYSVCKYVEEGKRKSDGHWEYWQETEHGRLIEGTEMETDYEDCPMWPGWCIPVYGQNWGRSYCEEYRGDFYILESNASALNDGATLASLALLFVKPGARTSLRQVQKARNLTMLSGSAEDVTTYRSEKGGDMQFIGENFMRAEQRIGKAFMVMSSAMRQGERVTAEEVERVGQDLDQAMGGVYTEIAQSHQRRMVTRFVRLNEEDDSDLPELPKDLVELEVITGVDAMGRSAEVNTLEDFAKGLGVVFPQKVQTILDPLNYAKRLASAMGIKPDGLVLTQDQINQATQQDQQQQMQAAVMPKVAAGASGPLAQGMLDRMPPTPGQVQQANMSQQPPTGAPSAPGPQSQQ